MMEIRWQDTRRRSALRREAPKRGAHGSIGVSFALHLVLLMAATACVAPTGSQGVQPGAADGSSGDAGGSAQDATQGAGTRVRIETNLGSIVVLLDSSKAPVSVANFLKYVDNKFYDSTLFHRVIKGFMVQGGGYAVSGQRKSTGSPIKNEATNGLKNLRGTLAMARTSQVHSATAQFFINHKDNGFLDHKDTSAKGYGYAVFGEVVSGMDVVDKIAAVPTGAKDKPNSNVVITSIRRIP